jgi:hypothetical protein
MRLSVRAMAMSAALVWGVGGMFATGLLNLLWPKYGEHFLLTMSSVYPGYHATRTIGEVLVGTGYGLTDGAICGLLFAWVYNLFASHCDQ